MRLEELLTYDPIMVQCHDNPDADAIAAGYGLCRYFDEQSEEQKSVSHECCNMYGRPASETVGLLDMYTDMNAGEPDRN